MTRSSDLPRQRMKKYGLLPGDFERWIVAQKGICPICEIEPLNKRGWHVDHDHQTGDVRGILCQACNIGLGQFRDDPERLRRAAQYLERTL